MAAYAPSPMRIKVRLGCQRLMSRSPAGKDHIWLAKLFDVLKSKDHAVSPMIT